MLSMTAITNKDYCMINTLVATMPDGKKYVFDRDMTEYSIRESISKSLELAKTIFYRFMMNL